MLDPRLKHSGMTGAGFPIKAFGKDGRQRQGQKQKAGSPIKTLGDDEKGGKDKKGNKDCFVTGQSGIAIF